MFYEAGYHQIWNYLGRRKPAPQEAVSDKEAAWKTRQETHVAFYGIIGHIHRLAHAAEDLQPYYNAMDKLRTENGGRLTLSQIGDFVDAKVKLEREYGLRECDMEQVAAYCREAASEQQLYDQAKDEARGNE